MPIDYTRPERKSTGVQALPNQADWGQVQYWTREYERWDQAVNDAHSHNRQPLNKKVSPPYDQRFRAGQELARATRKLIGPDR